MANSPPITLEEDAPEVTKESVSNLKMEEFREDPLKLFVAMDFVRSGCE